MPNSKRAAVKEKVSWGRVIRGKVKNLDIVDEMIYELFLNKGSCYIIERAAINPKTCPISGKELAPGSFSFHCMPGEEEIVRKAIEYVMGKNAIKFPPKGSEPAMTTMGTIYMIAEYSGNYPIVRIK